MPDTLAAVNIILSAGVVWFAWQNYRRTRWFLYGIFAAVWLAWVALYVFVLMSSPIDYDTVWFGASIVRPMNVTTFGLVLLVMW